MWIVCHQVCLKQALCKEVPGGNNSLLCIKIAKEESVQFLKRNLSLGLSSLCKVQLFYFILMRRPFRFELWKLKLIWFFNIY